MPLISEKQYTIEDIYQLPDGQRIELINGQMYLMAPPNSTPPILNNDIIL